MRKIYVIIAIGKAIGGLHVWKVLEDGLLHCELCLLRIRDHGYRGTDILYRDLYRGSTLARRGWPWSENKGVSAGDFRRLQLDHGE